MYDHLLWSASEKNSFEIGTLCAHPFRCGTAGQLSRWPHMPLLPCGVHSALRATRLTQSHFLDFEACNFAWRVLPNTDVGNVTQGHRPHGILCHVKHSFCVCFVLRFTRSVSCALAMCFVPCAACCVLYPGPWALCAQHRHPAHGVWSSAYRGGGFRAGEIVNLQILALQNLCHFLKMSEQIMYGSQKLLMRNSGRLLLSPGGLWMVAVISMAN